MKRSVEITQSTTLLQRFKSVILDPVNRRGLSESHMLFSLVPFRLSPLPFPSYCLWDASFPAALWFQYLNVLFSYLVQGNWIQPAYCCGANRIRDELYLHAGCPQVDRQDRKEENYDLECAWNGGWADARQYIIFL